MHFWLVKNAYGFDIEFLLYFFSEQANLWLNAVYTVLKSR